MNYQQNNNNQQVNISSEQFSSESYTIEYSDQHYLKLILIYFATMYFFSSVVQFALMFLYKPIFNSPTGYTNIDGQFVYYTHFQDFVNLWTQIIVYLAIFGVLVYFLIRVIKSDLLRSKENVSKIFLKALKGIALVYISSIICNIALTALQVVEDSENQSAIVSMLQTPQTFALILYCGILVIIAPIVEELIFRKAMFNYMRKFKFQKELKIFISGLLFGGIHVVTAIIVMLLESASLEEIVTEVLLGIPYCVMGFVLGYIYVDSDENVVVPTLVHMFNNGLSVVANLVLIYSQQ